MYLTLALNMSLTPEQINFISSIDEKVKKILSSGGNEISIMISLLDEISQMKTLINFEFFHLTLLTAVLIIKLTHELFAQNALSPRP